MAYININFSVLSDDLEWEGHPTHPTAAPLLTWCPSWASWWPRAATS